MKSLNYDKLIIGFLLGVCLMLLIGAAGSSSPKPAGTYQVAFREYKRDAWVLNTQTGQLWAVSDDDWSYSGSASAHEARLATK